MANLIDIRRRIRSVKNTQQITKAMKMVAAARLRRSQDKILSTRPYALEIRKVIGNLAARAGTAKHPLLAVFGVHTLPVSSVFADRFVVFAGGPLEKVIAGCTTLIDGDTPVASPGALAVMVDVPVCPSTPAMNTVSVCVPLGTLIWMLPSASAVVPALGCTRRIAGLLEVNVSVTPP
jgi:hypothetical protein